MKIQGLPKPLLRFAGMLLPAVLGLLLATGVGGRSAALEAEPLRHLRLVRTSPAADTVLTTAPAEIRLYFSEPPQDAGRSVRLTLGADQLVTTTEASPDPADAKQIVIRPEARLAPGTYRVHWRVMAQDGHTQRGEFDFRVQAR